ncbi:MAG TPA: PEGA domain-containing protein, partial [Ktedonobacterales bacterium]|nr:PEGA domain-containing protein [Ktedonobacterales bacterium]
RMALVGAPVAFALLVGSGVAVRAQMNIPSLALRPQPLKVAAAPAAALLKATPSSAEEKPPAEPAPKETKPPPTPVKHKGKHAVATARPPAKPEAASAKRADKVALAAPAAGAGVIQLAILPWGEVFVDGKSRGVSPPLRSVIVPTGAHTVEVRNTSFASHTQRVEVRPGNPVRIRHRFR